MAMLLNLDRWFEWLKPVVGILTQPLQLWAPRLCDAGYAAVDESEQPHLELDADIQDGEPIAESSASRSISFAPGKIMARDLERYGYTDDCPRCSDIKRGNHRSFRNHTDPNKIRIYFG